MTSSAPSLPADTYVLVRLTCRTKGSVPVRAEILAEHFAITPKLTDTGQVRPFGLNLTHVPSGRFVPVIGFPCREELRTLAQALAALSIDWATATAESLDDPEHARLLGTTIAAWDRTRRHPVRGTRK